VGETTQNSDKAVPVGKIFLAALAIRWAYDLILFAAMGEAGLTGPDSRFFLTLGDRMVDGVHSGAIHGWGWLGLEPHIMPLVTWAFAACVLLFGKMAPLGYVMLQGIFDACTCVLVCGMANSIAPRFALPAGVAAAVNPTQIVLSGIVYTDTPFVFLCALSLLASMQWLRSPSWGSSWLIGLSIGLAAMIRVLIVPWAVFLGFFLLAAQAIRGGLRIRQLGQVMLIGAITGTIVGPVLARNVTQFGAWALTPQAGAYVAYWLVPLVRETKTGEVWSQGVADMQKRARDRYGEQPSNPFQSARQLSEIGLETLIELGPAAIAKAWMFGAAINLGAPAIIISPPIFSLPRTGFYDTPGDTRIAKIMNFVYRSGNSIYLLALLAGAMGVIIVRLIQTVGLVSLLKTPGSIVPLLLFGAWLGFILVLDGPIASPKYRLPIEPPLMVCAGAGLCTLREHWRSRA